MYTWEIENYLASRNRIVTRDEFYQVVSQVNSPQITNVRYNKEMGLYELTTRDGGYMHFQFKE